MALINSLASKRFRTHFTVISNTLVLIHVVFIMATLGESFSAQIAIITKLAGMILHVMSKTTFCCEKFSTVGARNFFLERFYAVNTTGWSLLFSILQNK